eukprot:gene6792-9305_t
MIRSRQDLSFANRIVIKAGTSVVSTPEGYPCLSRMANIVEHAAHLVREGKEVLIVTSGAVGVGRQRLSKQATLRRSMSDLIMQKEPMQNVVGVPTANGKVSYNSACAAAGQLGLMSLYETMFGQFDITISQLLVTSFDFTSPERRRNIQYVISQLLSLGIVPLLNENDAVSANQGYQTFNNTFSDNDSLASLVSIEMNAQLLILLTDVKGVYDRPPNDPDAVLIDIFNEQFGFKAGQKSTQGRGGMSAKVDAALTAIKGGVQSVVIAAGHEYGVIQQIMSGAKAGTLFLQDHSNGSDDSESLNEQINVTEIIENDTLKHNYALEVTVSQVKKSQIDLQSVSSACRTAILLAMADYLSNERDTILIANEKDIEEAQKKGISNQLMKRLKLTNSKMDDIINGIRSVAAQTDPIDQILNKTELADGLILDKISCSIGVLLIIFESRPDCLPQIASLAIRSGNSLILKGGKEAELTNTALHSIVSRAIHDGSKGLVKSDVIAMVTSRSDVDVLLKFDQYIDLVIPRGSNALVSYIKSHTKIPVLGHADGVCHVYVDKFADPSKAERIVLDSKTDYPSACNAAECLLLHKDVVENGLADKLVRKLRAAGVTLYGSSTTNSYGLTEQLAPDFHFEYGDLRISIEIVNSTEDAINHINTFGSGHTECIISESEDSVSNFTKRVSSACVFHNASTRFADGFRFGLGAEVGISTSKIHARGPVGVEGLLTSKYVLRSTAVGGHTVASFANNEDGSKKCLYTHRKLL